MVTACGLSFNPDLPSASEKSGGEKFDAGGPSAEGDGTQGGFSDGGLETESPPQSGTGGSTGELPCDDALGGAAGALLCVTPQ